MPYFGIPIRNGLPIGLGSVAGFGISPFSPESLFENGEVGAWYDPSDYSTLFTDSAGTTPVTGVEQFVGLMLDKSQGLVLGPEIVVYPLSGILGASWTITGDTVVRNGSTGTARLNGTLVPATTSTYLLTFTVSNATGDSLAFRIGGGAAYGPVTGNGTFTYRILGGGAAAEITFLPWAGGAGTATISNISVRELPGNHAFQTSSAKRPKLAARYNLLTYSEDLSNVAWNSAAAGLTVTANAGIAPNGTNTATLLQETATTDHHRRGQTFTVGGLNRFSIFAKAAGANYLRIWSFAGGDTSGQVFDLVLGVATGTQNPTIEDAGNGWWRCSCNVTAPNSTLVIGPTTSYTTSTSTYLGDITKGVLVWGADLRPASQATGLIGPTYQRVAAATVYDTAGFLPYLAFDGLDDSMSTNSIDFSAGDKMTVWAGVRKLSDAALGLVAELSATANTNGAFFLAAPRDATTANYSVLLASTANLDARITTFAAPITNVITASLDISGATNADEVAIRANGVAQTPSYAGSNGTGNFGNHPLYIGARNNASLFFNGWLTSLIVRGAQSTQSQIEATEAWVNGKTGAY